MIGVAVYREAEPLPIPPQPAVSARERNDLGSAESVSGNLSDSMPASAPASPALVRSEALSKQVSRLGTGHGERISAPTQYAEFRRASEQPSEVVTIYYNSRANLLAQGIIPRPPSYGASNPVPNPFPGGFVPDPRS